MRRLIVVLGLVGFCCTSLLGQDSIPSPFDAARARFVDLSLPLNEKSPYWPGENYKPLKLETIATLEKNGVLSKAFSMPEHLGTHIDAPNHFEKDRPGVDAIPAEQLFGPGVVIDLALKCEMNPDTMLTVKDLTEWEQTHG